jgi:hypothetical protein
MILRRCPEACVALMAALVAPLGGCHLTAIDAELEPVVLLAINDHPEFTSGLGGALYFRLPEENAGGGMRVHFSEHDVVGLGGPAQYWQFEMTVDLSEKADWGLFADRVEPYLDFGYGFAFVDMPVLTPDEWPRNFTLSSTFGLRSDYTTSFRWKLCLRAAAWAYWPAVLWPFEYTDEPFGASAALVASVGFSL